MTDDTKIRLPFGCTKGLPDGVQVAWGARLIAPADLLWDRQGCAGGEEGGPERAKLLDWLGAGAGDKARDFCRATNMGVSNGDSSDVVTLYEDDQGMVVGSPQGSHGYVYIAAWLKEHVN
jgi:hypothetical protein